MKLCNSKFSHFNSEKRFQLFIHQLHTTFFQHVSKSQILFYNFGKKIPFLFDLIGWAWRMWGLSWGSWNNFQPFEWRLSWFHHQSLWSWNLPIWRTSRRLRWSSQHLVASYCQNHLQRCCSKKSLYCHLSRRMWSSKVCCLTFLEFGVYKLKIKFNHFLVYKIICEDIYFWVQRM